MMLKQHFSLIFMLFCCATAWSQTTHQLLRKGDRAYNSSNFGDAGKIYEDALKSAPDNQSAAYNLGNALYQQGKYEDAAKQYERAAQTNSNPAYKADVLHNLGNAYLQQHKYKESAESYENSLRLRPGDPDTKRNLQLVKRKLQEEKQKEPKPQQQKQDQKQQQNQDQQQDQNQQQKQDQQQNQDQKQQQNQDQNKQEPEPQQGKLSKQEAKRLLETAVGPDDQKNARKYREQQQKPKPKGTVKDW